MDSHSLFAFTLVAAIAIASPGPATLMAINNSLAHGQRSAVWSSLGNGSGLFCLSAAAMLGLVEPYSTGIGGGGDSERRCTCRDRKGQDCGEERQGFHTVRAVG